MLYQFRTENGGADPSSSGTFLDANGVATALVESDFSLEPIETWSSSPSGARYPVKWRITIPRLQMALDVSAALKDQELRLKPIIYWEGSVRAGGTVAGRSVKGFGYLEMTGYAGPIVGM
jgi:predicted secreted hydrolase